MKVNEVTWAQTQRWMSEILFQTPDQKMWLNVRSCVNIQHLSLYQRRLVLNNCQVNPITVIVPFAFDC